MRIVHFIGVILLLSTGCKPKETKDQWNSGEVDPSTFIAIGGGMTAGYMDDALYGEGQEYSLGNLISMQLQKVGGGSFMQPIIDSWFIGCNAEGLSRLRLGYKTDCLGISSLSPVRVASIGEVGVFNSTVFGSGIHNWGVPLLESTQLSNANLAQNNAYYARMSNPAAANSVLGSALQMQPTFFSFFVGVDEVLRYAKKGAGQGTLTPELGADGVGFEGSISSAIDQLTSSGAKGVVANIPDVTALPFFTTIPYNGLDLNAEKAASLNQIYNPIGLFFQVGPNPFVIQDPSAGAFGVRFMQPGELVLLSAPLDSVKCYQMGSVFPFRDEFVLTSAELTEIRNAIYAYNTILMSKANQKSLAFVDVHTWMEKLKSGIVYNGVSCSLKFVSGGIVSLDGVHFTPKGNALLANEFLKSVNTKYAAKVPLIDPNNYRSTIYP
jgi:hypothetical protein